MNHNEPRARKRRWRCAACGAQQSMRSWHAMPAGWHCQGCRDAPQEVTETRCCRCGAPAVRRLHLVALAPRRGPDLSDPICAGCYAAESWQPDARDVALAPAGAGWRCQGCRDKGEETET